MSDKKTQIIPSHHMEMNMKEIMELIGQGATGLVYKVENAKGSTYALKKIFKHKVARNIGRAEQLRRQIKILQSIKHENIAQFYSYEENKQFYQLKMEYIEGDNLKDFLLKNREMTVEERKRLGTLVTLNYIAALSAIRHKNIVNRDIKPDNIMVRKEGECFLVKMVDLGESRYICDMAESYKGTLGYMAPEIYRKESYSDLCDIWSLGVTLFQVFQGVHPIHTERQYLSLPFLEHTKLTYENCEKYYRNLNKDPLILYSNIIPQPIRWILRRMLQSDPRNRIGFLQIVQYLEKNLTQLADALSSQEIEHFQVQLWNCMARQKEAQSKNKEKQKLVKKITTVHQNIYKELIEQVELNNKMPNDDVLFLLKAVINRIETILEELKDICDWFYFEDSEEYIKKDELVGVYDYQRKLENFMQIKGIDKDILKIGYSKQMQEFIIKNFRHKEETMIKQIKQHIFNIKK